MKKHEKKNEVLDAHDVAAIFHRHVRTISRWRKAGKLKGSNIGSAYYYLLEDVKILIKKLKK